jgi:hypothetical protein
MMRCASLTVVWGTLLLSGCGWERKLDFASPSNRASVEIDQPFPINGAGIRIVVNANGVSKTVYELRVDAFLDFAAVAWSPVDDLAIFTCGTPSIKLAYSVSQSHPIPFTSMEPLLVSSLRRDYRLSHIGLKDEDVLEWACSPSGKHEFLGHYPSAAPR